jgi:Mg2+ and Co2+ transporter CorA
MYLLDEQDAIRWKILDFLYNEPRQLASISLIKKEISSFRRLKKNEQQVIIDFMIKNKDIYLIGKEKNIFKLDWVSPLS